MPQPQIENSPNYLLFVWSSVERDECIAWGERVGEEKRVGLGFSKEWLKFGYFGGKHLLFMEELVQVQIVCASFTSYILRTYARRRARSRIRTYVHAHELKEIQIPAQLVSPFDDEK